jgi:hypothetical protein
LLTLTRALAVRILLLLAGFLPAALLLAGLLTRVLVLLTRILVLVRHGRFPLVVDNNARITSVAGNCFGNPTGSPKVIAWR